MPWENISFQVSQKVHYTPKSSRIDLKYGEFFIGYEPKNWLEYGAGYRLSYLNLNQGNWLNENRLMAFVDFSKVISAFELSFSNRFEYRSFKDIEKHFRYKQALQLNFPSITNWGMQFYLSEESYYKMNGVGTHLARFYSGVKALEKEHFKMKLYYSLEKAKAFDNWISSDIVGLNLSFAI